MTNSPTSRNHDDESLFLLQPEQTPLAEKKKIFDKTDAERSKGQGAAEIQQQLLQIVQASQDTGPESSKVRQQLDELKTRYDLKLRKGRNKSKIRAALGRILQNKMVALHGKKKGNQILPQSDIDAIGGLLLLQEAGLIENIATTPSNAERIHYIGHTDDDRLEHALHIDVSNKDGFIVEPGASSSLINATIFTDHHPTGWTSSTGIIYKVLETLDMLPSDQAKLTQMRNFTNFVDIYDSMGYELIGADFDHMWQTLSGVAKLISPQDIYKLIGKFSGGFGSIDEATAKHIQVTQLTGQTSSLREVMQYRKRSSQKSKNKALEMIQEQKVVHGFNQDFIVNIGGELKLDKEASLALDKGTITVHEAGDIYVYNPGEFAPSLVTYFAKNHTLSKMIRQNIIIIRKDDPNYEEQYTMLLDYFQNTGKRDILAQLKDRISDERYLYKDLHAYDATPDVAEKQASTLQKAQLDYEMFHPDMLQLKKSDIIVGQTYVGYIVNWKPYEVTVQIGQVKGVLPRASTPSHDFLKEKTDLGTTLTVKVVQKGNNHIPIQLKI